MSPRLYFTCRYYLQVTHIFLASWKCHYTFKKYVTLLDYQPKKLYILFVWCWPSSYCPDRCYVLFLAGTEPGLTEASRHSEQEQSQGTDWNIAGHWASWPLVWHVTGHQSGIWVDFGLAWSWTLVSVTYGLTLVWRETSHWASWTMAWYLAGHSYDIWLDIKLAWSWPGSGAVY